MPLDIDSSRALRTHDQLVELVQAVARARTEDESRSVEWKTGYSQLTSADASFSIGRAVLGLANRPVSVSSAAFEGVGYVVIGAEPGSVHGQHVPDSAELLNAIRRFTGHGWPLWDSRSVRVNDRNVLVVTVEPPRDGDRIALLQKNFQPAKGGMVAEGTIFVRQPGATERASKADVEMLQDRLLAGVGAQAAAQLADRNNRLRALVSDAVGSATRWADTMEILTLATAADRWRQRDWVEFVNTDSGRQMTQDMQTTKECIRNLRLLTTDKALLQALQVADELLLDKKAFVGIHAEGPNSGEARTVAYRHFGELKNAWVEVERAAITSLAE